MDGAQEKQGLRTSPSGTTQKFSLVQQFRPEAEGEPTSSWCLRDDFRGTDLPRPLPQELCLKVAALLARCGPGTLNQHRLQPWGAFSDAGRSPLAGTLIEVRDETRPGKG